MSPSSLTSKSSIKTIFRSFGKSKLDMSTYFMPNIDNIVFICWDFKKHKFIFVCLDTKAKKIVFRF